jgi:hypothetical protein
MFYRFNKQKNTKKIQEEKILDIYYIYVILYLNFIGKRKVMRNI